MNYADLLVIGVIVLAVIVAVYQTFYVSVASFASYLFSWFMAVTQGPKLAAYVCEHSELYQKVLYFSAGSSKVKSIADRALHVSDLTAAEAERIVSESGLTAPFDKLTLENIVNQKLPELTTVGEYFEYSVGNILMNAVCFILVFLFVWMICAIAIMLLKNSLDLPQLKHFDWLLAGGVGVAKGFIILYFVFALIPVVSILMSLPALVTDVLNESQYYELFIENNIVTYFISGVIG